VRTHDDTRKKRLPAVAGAIAILLFMAGCSVGPKYVRPEVKVNADWNENGNSQLAPSAADSSWWRTFNDATLDSLIQLGYHQNLPLRVAGLRIMESRAQLALAVGNKYPQLQVAFASATGVQVSEHAANTAAIDRNFWDFQIGFDAFWELDFWGKFKNGERAETASFLASIADYDNALVSLNAEVARAYAVIRTFEVLLDQARTNAALQEEGLRIAESRFRNGATSELDVSQATTLLESTRATIPELEASLAQAENALSTLLGQPTGTLQTLLQGSSGIPVAPPQVSVSVPAELLRRRPDIRSAEFQAVAQSARIGIAKADLYPSFSLSGEIGTQTSEGGGAMSGHSTISNIFSAGSFFYSFGPRILYSVFNYGRTKNRIRIEDARLQQSLVDYQNTVLKAAQEVEDGLSGYLKSQEAAVFAQNAATAAQRSVELATIQYREGAVDYQRVLDAQRSLLQEENTLARTRSSIATNLISVYKALGGGWEMRQGQPFVPDSTRIEMQNRTNWGGLFEKTTDVKHQP
jgi:NodT family efflux transporter outer membrane factor (OMF) lipoprotein